MADPRPTFSSVVQAPGFRYLWLNQILVQLAYNTLNFTLIIWVYKLTDSNLAVSTLMLAMYLPAIFFSIFAGVFVDIADRRKIIILIDALLVFLFSLFILIKGSYLLILLDIFLINSLAQFFVPAEGSSIPMLVHKKALLIANSLFSLTLYGSFMIGFSAAGPILNFFGINTAFYLTIGFLITAFIISQNLPIIKVSRIDSRFDNFLSLRNFDNMLKITLSELKTTLSYIKGRPSIFSAILLLSFVQGIIGILAVLMPSYMEKVLKIHATDTSYFVMVPLGLGMISGALIIGRWAHNLPRRSIVIPAILIAGLLFLIAGATPTLAHLFQISDIPTRFAHPRYFFRAPSVATLFAAGAYLLGLCAVGIIIPCQTVVQESTTKKVRGKIFAVLSFFMYALTSIPVLLSGALADIFGPTLLFFILGVIVFMIGLIAYKPAVFLSEKFLPLPLKNFLGSGHWIKS